MGGGGGFIVRGLLLFCGLLGIFAGGWLIWWSGSSRRALEQASVPTVMKQPVVFASLTFDPAAPPAEMPPLGAGENAECDSDFRSAANVRGESRQKDATHATMSITQINVI